MNCTVDPQSTANAVMQYCLDWSEVNGMQLNLEKTKAMAIRRHRSAQTLKTSDAENLNRNRPSRSGVHDVTEISRHHH